MRWCDGLDEVSVPVECAGATHWVTWRRGKVILDDHPNLAAERALIALGGGVSGCLFLLKAWATVTKPGTSMLVQCERLLSAGPAGPFPPRAGPPQPPARRRPGITDPALLSVLEARLAHYHLEHVLLDLPGALGSRWLLGAAAGFERRWAALSAMDRLDLDLALGASARGSVARGMRSWQRLNRVQKLVIGCHVVAPDQPATMTGRVNGRQAEADVELPLSWLRSVWAPGLPLVDGCFVLGVQGDRAEVVRWERGTAGITEAVTVSARLWSGEDGTWHLRW